MTITSGVLVVLFHPSAAQVSNLLRLKGLVEDIVAVDNSPVLNERLRQRVLDAGIDILHNANQGGVAGAYNIGLERLIGKRCRLLFILDQDSAVPDDYFIQMANAGRALDSPCFLIGPKIFDVNVNRYLPAHIVHRFSVKPIPITDHKHGLVPCSSIISSGSMMSAETYRSLGPFPEEYVIDQVDTEYSFRAVAKGVPVYINTSVALQHEVGKRMDHKLLSFTIMQWNLSPLRQYYSARNCIHVSRRYGKQFPLLTLVNIITLQQILSVALYEKDKHKKFIAMMAGIIDGLGQRYGSFETCRPRTFAFCAK